MLSIVITTCAQAAHAGPRYHQREYALRNFILPFYVSQGIADLWVVGQWNPEISAAYKTAQIAPTYGNILDALEQRQLGLEQCQGDVILFQSDDHICFDVAKPFSEDGHVLVPDRWTRMRGYTERVNNGKDEGYAPFHGAFYRRDVLEKVPWTTAYTTPPLAVDVCHSALVKQAGFTITHTEAIRMYDVELGATPWA